MDAEKEAVGKGQGENGVTAPKEVRRWVVGGILLLAFLAISAAIFTVWLSMRKSEERRGGAAARIANAVETFAQAEQQGTARYAPQEWDLAKRALESAQLELSWQAKTFFLKRSYDPCLRLTEEAITAIAAAQKSADANRHVSRPAPTDYSGGSYTNQANVATSGGSSYDAKVAIDSMKASFENARVLMAVLEKCRRKPKDLKKDLELAKGNLDGYGAQVTDLDWRFGKGDYSGAKAQADTLKGQIDRMVAFLEDAKMKNKC